MSGITTISGRPAVICSASPVRRPVGGAAAGPVKQVQDRVAAIRWDAYPRGSSMRTFAGPGSAEVRTVSAIRRESSRCVDATRMPSAALNRTAPAADGNRVTAPSTPRTPRVLRTEPL